MAANLFTTPQDAEQAFYEAFERGDVDAMMAVWAEDEEVVCTHPNSVRLAGAAMVREGWRQIFAAGGRLRVRTSNATRWQGMLLAVHSVFEEILVQGQDEPHPPLVATNVYARTPQGWRMVAHHASPMPVAPQESSTEEPPRILH